MKIKLGGVKIVPTSVEDERAANPEPVKPPGRTRPSSWPL